MKKNKKVYSNNLKKIEFKVLRYFIYTADPQFLIDLKNDNLTKFYELISKSRNDACDLISLFRDAIIELEKDIDFLDSIDDRLMKFINNG